MSHHRFPGNCRGTTQPKLSEFGRFVVQVPVLDWQSLVASNSGTVSITLVSESRMCRQSIRRGGSDVDFGCQGLTESPFAPRKILLPFAERKATMIGHVMRCGPTSSAGRKLRDRGIDLTEVVHAGVLWLLSFSVRISRDVSGMPRQIVRDQRIPSTVTTPDCYHHNRVRRDIQIRLCQR
jgi:hypothetical protein